MKLTSSTNQTSFHSNPPAGSLSISNQSASDDRAKLIVKTVLGTLGAVAAGAAIYRMTNLPQIENKIYPVDIPVLPLLAFGALGGLCVKAYTRTESHSGAQRPLKQKKVEQQQYGVTPPVIDNLTTPTQTKAEQQQNGGTPPVIDNPTTSTQTNFVDQERPVVDSTERGSEKKQLGEPTIIIETKERGQSVVTAEIKEEEKNTKNNKLWTSNQTKVKQQQNDDPHPANDNPTTSTQTIFTDQERPVVDSTERDSEKKQLGEPTIIIETKERDEPDVTEEKNEEEKNTKNNNQLTSNQSKVNEQEKRVYNEKPKHAKLESQPIPTANKEVVFFEGNEILQILSSRNVILNSTNNSNEANEEANSKIKSLRNKYNTSDSIVAYLKKFPQTRLENLKKYYSTTLKLNEILLKKSNFDLNEVTAVFSGVKDVSNKAAKIAAYEWAAISYLLNCNIIDFVDKVINFNNNEKNTKNNRKNKKTLSINSGS